MIDYFIFNKSFFMISMEINSLLCPTNFPRNNKSASHRSFRIEEMSHIDPKRTLLFFFFFFFLYFPPFPPIFFFRLLPGSFFLSLEVFESFFDYLLCLDPLLKGLFFSNFYFLDPFSKVSRIF